MEAIVSSAVPMMKGMGLLATADELRSTAEFIKAVPTASRQLVCGVAKKLSGIQSAMVKAACDGEDSIIHPVVGMQVEIAMLLEYMKLQVFDAHVSHSSVGN